MQVEKTQTITMDNESFDVTSLSAEVQQMVAYLDDWRQREVDLTSNLLMVRGALRDLQNALVEQIQKDASAKNEPASSPAAAVQDVKAKPAKKAKK